jgi:hypothetical protein
MESGSVAVAPELSFQKRARVKAHLRDGPESLIENRDAYWKPDYATAKQR